MSAARRRMSLGVRSPEMTEDEEEALDELGDRDRPAKRGPGRPPRYRERRRVTLYLPPGLAKRLKLYAVMQEMEMSEVAEDALRAYLPAED